MFKDRASDGIEVAGGTAPLSAQLSYAQIADESADALRARTRILAQRYSAWRHRISARFAEVDAHSPST